MYSYKQNIPRDVVEVVESVDTSWALGKSECGWMTSLTFFDYMSQVFEPWLSEDNVTRPVLVFADGHKSHLSLETADLCAAKQIILVALYPNSTHMLQPLDVSVFKALKSHWEKAKHAWKAYHMRDYKETFPPMGFKDATNNVDVHVMAKLCLQDRYRRRLVSSSALYTFASLTLRGLMIL